MFSGTLFFFNDPKDVGCLISAAAAAAAKSLQSCPTLCDPIDGSPPGSTVPEILQARVLEWSVIAFSDLISGSSVFSKSSLNIWNFMVHILLKPSLENFEHYFASV